MYLTSEMTDINNLIYYKSFLAKADNSTLTKLLADL